jgi:hypothetical protein
VSPSRALAAVLGLVLAAGLTTGSASVPTAQAAETPVPAPSASTGECPPGIGIALLEFPRDREDDPRARSYVIDHVRPGTSFTRRFKACNGTDRPATVSLYAGAAGLVRGSFVPADGRTQNELSGWISVTPSTLALPAGRAGTFSATFAVPRDATEGERYAVVQVEGPPSGSGPVGSIGRAGVRVYLSVGPGGEPRSDFDVESLQASRGSDGVPRVTARVRNTGARALDMRGSLKLTEGPGGLSSRDYPATVGTTLGVGEVGPVEVVLDRAITGGPWLATLTMQSGTLTRVERGRITFPDAVGTAAPPVESEDVPLAKDRDFLLPVAGGLIGLLFLLLLVAALLTSRRKRSAGAA